MSAFVFCTASFPRGNGNEQRIVVTICQMLRANYANCAALRIIAIRRIIVENFVDHGERERETLRYIAAFFVPRIHRERVLR